MNKELIFTVFYYSPSCCVFTFLHNKKVSEEF